MWKRRCPLTWRRWQENEVSKAFGLLIFDWDGTLVDSLARIVTCLQISSGELGLPVPSDEDSREIIGLGLPQALAKLFPGAEREEFLALRECYSRNFQDIDREPAPFYPTARETLEELKNKGYLLAVATGKSRRGLDRALQGHALTDFFDASRCADESVSKPDPRMLFELLEHFGLPADTACMVGDTEFDMDMAARAGVARIGVSYGAHGADRLHGYSLRGCAATFDEILAWV